MIRCPGAHASPGWSPPLAIRRGPHVAWRVSDHRIWGSQHFLAQIHLHVSCHVPGPKAPHFCQLWHFDGMTNWAKRVWWSRARNFRDWIDWSSESKLHLETVIWQLLVLRDVGCTAFFSRRAGGPMYILLPSGTFTSVSISAYLTWRFVDYYVRIGFLVQEIARTGTVPTDIVVSLLVWQCIVVQSRTEIIVCYISTWTPCVIKTSISNQRK